jgi:tetratricopeptide (TPR) repeat protein
MFPLDNLPSQTHFAGHIMRELAPTRLLALCVALSLHPAVTGDPPAAERKDAPNQERPARNNRVDAEEIKRLIEQLGSANFTEREAATKRLKTIGEPALIALQEAATTSKDPEIRRRASQLAAALAPDPLYKLFYEAVRHEEKKNYKRADELFDDAIKRGMERFHPDLRSAPREDIPFLTEVFLHSGRVARELESYEKAGRAYHRAQYYSNYNNEKRRQIDIEWSAMVTHMLAGWADVVKTKTDRDQSMKAMVAKYPLVLLHSRRYAGGGYLQSAYSFLYESADVRNHHNDVQLLFDNSGRHNNMFETNMVVGQENRVADLGDVAFDKDADPGKIAAHGEGSWSSNTCKAVEGHVYLEHVKDRWGNDFFVLFKVVAVEKESKYLAFVWRRLPGGKVVKR